MVIVSAKISKKKALWAILAVIGVIVLLTFLLQQSDPPTEQPSQTEHSLNGGSNEERVAFLEGYGWQAASEPTQTQEVRIPQQFNEVFTRYNDLQQEQGFDLSAYAGKIAKRYVYKITNHPGGDQDHAATVLVYRNKIIGGDVTNSKNGSMHGFAMPE